jgi:hypothetical protein
MERLTVRRRILEVREAIWSSARYEIFYAWEFASSKRTTIQGRGDM